jgi:hypothetical protein
MAMLAVGLRETAVAPTGEGVKVDAALLWLLFGLNALGLFGSTIASGVTRGLSQVVVTLTAAKS